MKTKQKVIIIITSVAVVAAISVGTLFFLKNSDTDTVEKKPVVSQQTVDDLKTQALKALKDNNPEAAKKLFEQAKAQYISLDDVNGETDMEAQIYLIDNAKE